jgi:hypothetical protein
MKTLSLSLIFILSSSLAAGANVDTQKAGSPHSVVAAASSCVDTTVRSVTPRLGTGTTFTRQDFINSGVDVTFNTHLGVPSGWASVVHYQQTAGNNVMMNERAGNRVRVCFLGGPKADQYCHPSTDPRGRKFSVYDYRQHASYSGINSEHDCGGA